MVRMRKVASAHTTDKLTTMRPTQNARGLVPGLDSVAGTRVVIQGFGNAGGIAAQLFHAAGAKIIAVSDSHGGIAAEQGLTPDAILALGSIVGREMGWKSPPIFRLPAAEQGLIADGALVSIGKNGHLTVHPSSC